MLKRRVIPKVLVAQREMGNQVREVVVRTKNFKVVRLIGEPVSQIRIYEDQCADEIALVRKASEWPDWHRFLHLVQRVNSRIATPLSVGGGVVDVSQVAELLFSGADKVVIGKGIYQNKTLFKEVVERYGSQCCVAAVDVIKVDRDYVVEYSDRQRESLEEAMARCREANVGELLVTSVDRDGMGDGADTELIRSCIDISECIVIASGGLGTAAHFADALKAGADAVAASTYFTDRDQNQMQCKAQLYNSGFAVRRG